MLFGEAVFDEVRDEVGQFAHGIVEFFLDAGEIFAFGLGVLIEVRTACLAPLAGVERIDHAAGSDEVEGIDDAGVVERALPEFMQALAIGIQQLDGLHHVHQRALLAREFLLC